MSGLLIVLLYVEMEEFIVQKFIFWLDQSSDGVLGYAETLPDAGPNSTRVFVKVLCLRNFNLPYFSSPVQFSSSAA